MADNNYPSLSAGTRKRLPGYFLVLRSLLLEQKLRVTAAELARRSGQSLPVLRLDLKRIGEEGRPGYGYYVRVLYLHLSAILGVGEGYKAIWADSGDTPILPSILGLLGRSGVILEGDPVPCSPEALRAAALERTPDIVIFGPGCVCADELAASLRGTGVRGIWNLSPEAVERLPGIPRAVNLDMASSLMSLCCSLTAEREIQ